MRGSEQVTQQWERTKQGRTVTGTWQTFGRMRLNMTNKTKRINVVYMQVMLIRLNRIRSSIRTLGNYKQVIGKTK